MGVFAQVEGEKTGSGGRIRASEGAFFSLLRGRFVGLLSGVCVVFVYYCLLVFIRGEGFCSLFCSHCMVKLSL